MRDLTMFKHVFKELLKSSEGKVYFVSEEAGIHVIGSCQNSKGVLYSVEFTLLFDGNYRLALSNNTTGKQVEEIVPQNAWRETTVYKTLKELSKPNQNNKTLASDVVRRLADDLKGLFRVEVEIKGGVISYIRTGTSTRAKVIVNQISSSNVHYALDANQLTERDRVIGEHFLSCKGIIINYPDANTPSYEVFSRLTKLVELR